MQTATAHINQHPWTPSDFYAAQQQREAEYNRPENVAARAEAERKRLHIASGHCVRDTPLDENEVALFTRLKLITDTKKLQARLPAWIKKHQKSVQPPKQFEFIEGAKPVYPAHVKAAFTRQSDPGLERQYPNDGAALSTAGYVSAFYRANNWSMA